MNNNMPSVESESISAKKKREIIMRELVKGHEAATQLNLLLQKPFETQPSLSSQQLIAIVLRSFTQSLSIITSSSAHHLPHQNLLNSGENCSPVPGSGNGQAIGDFTESGKRSQKGGKGRYNTRRSALTWNKISCTTDDNHAWRKYGQKGTLNSDFPRSYFRCSHKYDQGCRATKQVQRDQKNPKMYQTTYIGIHTCNNATPDATQSDTDSYRDYNVPNLQDHHHTCSPTLTMNQEFPKENTSSDVTDDNLDSILWSDLKDFEPYIQAFHCALNDGI